MDATIAIVLSGIFSIVVAYLTATYRTRIELEKEKTKRHLDVVIQQKYEYLRPFKYCAGEFKGRLAHIIGRLNEKGEKHENMVGRFQQNFENQQHEWFFCDEVGTEGGYYITSTVHMNCMLFYWIKRVQYEYPYIPLLINETKQGDLDKYNIYAGDGNWLWKIKRECTISDFIRNIKIILAGEGGIPYGIHDSLGDYMYNHSQNRLKNYDEFCTELRDDTERIKFGPILKYWTKLIDEQGNVIKAKKDKIDKLMLILGLLQKAKVRE